MRLTIPVLMMMAVPALAGAQQAEANVAAGASAQVSSNDAAVTATGDAAADARIEQAAARVRSAGVSSASIGSRVQLGKARGVTAARIAAAVEQRADALLAARDAIGASTSTSTRGTATLELAADAIESGAHASQVAQVVAGFDGDEHSRALAALGVLAAEGRIGADVLASVQSAIDAGIGASAATGAAAGLAGQGADAALGANGAANAAGSVGGAAVGAGAAATGVVNGAL